MTVRVSSKFKERILGPESFPSIFNGGIIRLYTGGQPESADHPVQGTLVGQVTNLGQAWAPDGTPAGLQFENDGVWVAKLASQSWILSGLAAGTAGWFRLYGPALDNGGYSFAAPRIDGTVGITGSVDMKLVTAALSVGYTAPVQQFLFSFPPLLGA